MALRRHIASVNCLLKAWQRGQYRLVGRTGMSRSRAPGGNFARQFVQHGCWQKSFPHTSPSSGLSHEQHHGHAPVGGEPFAGGFHPLDEGLPRLPPIYHSWLSGIPTPSTRFFMGVEGPGIRRSADIALGWRQGGPSPEVRESVAMLT